MEYKVLVLAQEHDNPVVRRAIEDQARAEFVGALRLSKREVLDAPAASWTEVEWHRDRADDPEDPADPSIPLWEYRLVGHTLPARARPPG